MSFDKETRNALSKMVATCRRLLTEDVTDQLRGRFGMHSDGTILSIDRLDLAEDEKAAAKALRELLHHFATGEAEPSKRKAYDRLVLEVAFTTFNRFAALRLCEERGFVVECVRKGTASDGFRLFERVSGGVLGTRYQTYRVFLECLFNELAPDLGILFDRATPQSAVFPGDRCLTDVLAELNKAELAHLWEADETIGWIYQYFNPPEERKAMRDASQVPRNSRELAVRNQFFTPRYVVEFLTDNTLGRIWYEMRKGDTFLKEECRYLVPRPTEVFLPPGHKARPSEERDFDLPQGDLLQQPVHIDHRPKKDPRDLRVLDPACGSGHFLLYAFDLLERVYEEAWGDPETPESEVTGHTLGEDFESLADLRRATPKLIVEHNLHGIDIDSRAVQIAALALWLRAQTTWKTLTLRPTERPRIERSNIVTAEPMPGEEDMRREFAARLKPRVLGQLVVVVFEKMKLAAEAGSLLRIEDELHGAVALAKSEHVAEQRRRRNEAGYFTGMAPTRATGLFDFTDLNQDEFWEKAEDLILAALKEQAAQVDNGGTVRRRLFADDAARGFAFIDLCRRRYDAVLMNPPFGEFPTSLRKLGAEAYQESKSDIGSSMVTRGLELVHDGGYIAALVSRLFIVNDGLAGWRERSLISQSSVDSMVDLGYGVLDGALVEVAGLCIRSRSAGTSERPAFFLRVLDEQDKEHALACYFAGSSLPRTFSYSALPSSFRAFRKTLLCYWLPNRLASALRDNSGLADVGANAHFGASTSDDFQFVRLRWEVNSENLKGRRWVPFAKGGEYVPFVGDISLVLEWHNDGCRLKEFVGRKSFETQGAGGWTRWINGVEFYFQEGLTYPERTTSDLCPQVLPSECLFSAIGSAIHFPDRATALSFLGVAFTRPFKILADAIVGSGDSSVSGSAARHYRPGIVNSLPLLGGNLDAREIQAVESCVNLTKERHSTNEVSWSFTGSCFYLDADDLATWAVKQERLGLDSSVQVIELCAELEDGVIRRLGLTQEDIASMEAEFGPHPSQFSRECSDERVDEIRNAWSTDESSLIAQTASRQGARRQLTKKTYVSDRRLELLAQRFRIHPSSLVSALIASGPHWRPAIQSRTRDLLSYCIGCAMGRWDLRLALDPSLARGPSEPFDPLPVCSPGMLVGAIGVPAESGHVVSEAWLRARPEANALRGERLVKNPIAADSDYPLRICWDGVLVDDPGFSGSQPGRDDIVRRVREVLDLLCKNGAHEIEQEARSILGLSDLRDYFRKPTQFFQDHLKRYSKSRRRAPIYWPLSTVSGSYTVWLYYPRLTEETLYGTVNKYLEPKIEEIGRVVVRIERELEVASGRKATGLRDQLDESQRFVSELRQLRQELLRVAALPYRPNRDDGVIINAAPFNTLFRLRSWAKDTATVWKKLEEGQYDWAHLAYTLWPERVKEVCRRDRSIAIAHGLEDLCEVGPSMAVQRRKR